MGAPEFRFDPASHTYTVGGVVIESVTTLLKPMEDLSAIPPAILARKAALGTAVHFATELDDQDDLDEESLSPEIKGYLDGWRRFKAEHNFVPESIEQQLYHPTHWYAGTIDRCGLVDGERFTIDIKTRIEIPAVVGIQLAAYNELLRENGVVDRRKKLGNMAVQLLPNGQYKIHPFSHGEHYPAWLSLLTLRNWRNKHART